MQELVHLVCTDSQVKSLDVFIASLGHLTRLIPLYALQLHQELQQVSHLKMCGCSHCIQLSQTLLLCTNDWPRISPCSGTVLGHNFFPQSLGLEHILCCLGSQNQSVISHSPAWCVTSCLFTLAGCGKVVLLALLHGLLPPNLSLPQQVSYHGSFPHFLAESICLLGHNFQEKICSQPFVDLPKLQEALRDLGYGLLPTHVEVHLGERWTWSGYYPFILTFIFTK